MTRFTGRKETIPVSEINIYMLQDSLDVEQLNLIKLEANDKNSLKLFVAEMLHFIAELIFCLYIKGRTAPVEDITCLSC